MAAVAVVAMMVVVVARVAVVGTPTPPTPPPPPPPPPQNKTAIRDGYTTIWMLRGEDEDEVEDDNEDEDEDEDEFFSSRLPIFLSSRGSQHSASDNIQRHVRAWPRAS